MPMRNGIFLPSFTEVVNLCHMLRVISIAKAGPGQLGLAGHQFLVFVVVYKGDAAANARLAVHEAPGKEAYLHWAGSW